MAAEQVAPGLYQLKLGISSAFLLDSAEDGCILFDTGYPDKQDAILGELRRIGKQPSDLRHIVLTHAHPDHIGSLRALQAATGATTYIHAADAAIARKGSGFRPLRPAPGLVSWLAVQIIGRKNRTMAVGESRIDVEVQDEDVLPLAGGLRAVHTPGHCLGHVAYLWQQHGGVLIAGDVCGNMRGLDWSIGYEDISEGGRSLRKLAGLSFETACFGHGKPIVGGADRQFRKKWVAASG